jgi:DNA mismatch endonuclease, patch repair protein
MDFLTRSERSKRMSLIRSRGNNDTEAVLTKLFRRHKITGWRRHQKIFGKPDFIFPKLRLAVFVDGCFWHNCPKHGTKPKGNAAFWNNKFARNKARDFLVTRALRAQGWRVLRIWEHELTRKNEVRLLRRIQRMLAQQFSHL